MNIYVKAAIYILLLAYFQPNLFWWKDDVMNILGFETCSHHHVRNSANAAEALEQLLKDRLFGQHLIHKGLRYAIESHLRKEKPVSPLVISLNGEPGCGKSLTAEVIAHALYIRGERSHHVKFFTASHHFPDLKKVEEYKVLIKNTIKNLMLTCPNSLIVFDEVDKMPPGLLDVLIPLITHTGPTLDGITYKKAIYIFQANSGFDTINNVTLAAYQSKRRISELSLEDFRGGITDEAFKVKGGFYRSELIQRFKIEYFIPYLPMERRHVLECFRREARKHPFAYLDEEKIEELANSLVYWPKNNSIYSTTGCKRVEQLVLFDVERQRDNRGRRML